MLLIRDDKPSLPCLTRLILLLVADRRMCYECIRNFFPSRRHEPIKSTLITHASVVVVVVVVAES